MEKSLICHNCLFNLNCLAQYTVHCDYALGDICGEKRGKEHNCTKDEKHFSVLSCTIVSSILQSKIQQC